MSRVVWKYPLGFGSATEITGLPLGSKIVHVATDPASKHPCLWIELDDDGPADFTLKMHVFGTGRPIEAGNENVLEHVGSIIEDDTYVWHIYRERTPDEALVRSMPPLLRP